MNPEAVAWLEHMTEAEHVGFFRPPAGEPAKLFSLKDDHESCGFCPHALCWGNLLVVGGE